MENTSEEKEKIAPKGQEDFPLMDQVIYMAPVIWRWFKDLPLLARIVLTLLALYILPILLNIMVQLATLLMDPVYTILGIIASALVIHDFLTNKRKKRVEKGVNTDTPKIDSGFHTSKTDEKPIK